LRNAQRGAFCTGACVARHNNFQTYFEKNYLRLNTEGDEESTDSIYHIDFWNAFNRIQNGVPRTSNNAESWNRTLNGRIVITNPNIALFITNILKCEELDIYDLKRCHFGIFEFKKTRKEDVIALLIKNYKHFSRKEYMEALLIHVFFKFEKEEKQKKKSGVNGNSNGGRNDSQNRPEDEIDGNDDLNITKNESKGNDNSDESLTNYFNEEPNISKK
jgi:hypothetical protein